MDMAEHDGDSTAGDTMILFWIGFTIMVLNEGFVIMRHVHPWFARKRRKLTKDIVEGVTQRRWGRLRKLRKNQ